MTDQEQEYIVKVPCPKCGWQYGYECQLSKWMKCLKEGCGVVFDKEGKVITHGERIKGKQSDTKQDQGGE